MNIQSFYKIAALILGALFFISCSKDDNFEIPPSGYVNQTRYYVKYEVSFNTQHVNTVKSISFATENGTESIKFTDWTKTKNWEGTYGPVGKDFKASIRCDVENYSYSSVIHARIYLSREKEPFVIKAEGEGEYSLSLQTNIDF
ncbi:MAG: hypothetical protein II222_02900 [Paraprevotella sp.]|nr:hypothetical protein [Paraprevotella sp.]